MGYRAEMAERYGATGAAAADDLLQNRRPAVSYDLEPLAIRIVDELPMTPTGKIAKGELLERALQTAA